MKVLLAAGGNVRTDHEQVDIALDWIKEIDIKRYYRILSIYPEFADVKYDSDSMCNWFDWEAMGIDHETVSSLVHTIEEEGDLIWEDGDLWREATNSEIEEVLQGRLRYRFVSDPDDWSARFAGALLPIVKMFEQEDVNGGDLVEVVEQALISLDIMEQDYSTGTLVVCP